MLMLLIKDNDHVHAKEVWFAGSHSDMYVPHNFTEGVNNIFSAPVVVEATDKTSRLI